MVAFHLPTKEHRIPTDPWLVILVDTEERKDELAEWPEATPGQIRDTSGYWWQYGLVLASAAKLDYILSFEKVEMESGEPSMWGSEDSIRIAAEGMNSARPTLGPVCVS